MIEELKRKNGSVYRASIYGVDKIRKTKVFPTKTLAKEWERRMLRQRDEEEATGLTVKDSHNFEEFADRWFKEKVLVRLSPSTRTNYQRVLHKHLLPLFGQMKLRDFRMEHGNRLVAKLAGEGHAPKGINIIVGVLLTILNDAVDWQCLARNPLYGFKQVKEPDLTFDYFSSAEIELFLSKNKADPYFPIYVVALNTGMRRGEICALKWDRIDFIRNLIVVNRSTGRYGLIETTKTGKARHVPMNPVVRGLLEKLWNNRKSDFVFCDESGNPVDAHHAVPRAFTRAQRRAGLDRVIRFHDLRHTFASHFMMNKGSIYDLQKILGHASLEMTQRYAHLSEDHLANAIKLVSFGAEEDGVVTSISRKKRNSVVTA